MQVYSDAVYFQRCFGLTRMSDLSLTRYIQAIKTHFPDLKVRSTAFLSEGWANRLFLVNDALVFRFPKDATSEQHLLREIRLLPLLAPSLPLAVPHYTYIAPPSDVYPYVFVGYPFIPGVPLQTTSEATRNADWWRPPVGAFLTALHGISTDTVVTAGLDGYPTAGAQRAARVAKHARYADVVFPLLTSAQQHAIAEYLQTVLDDERMLSFTPVILHQDFGFQNLLVDVAAQQVTGVIDWGSCTVGDPALDVPREVEPYYAGVIDPGWDFRREYYGRTGAFEDLLYLCTHAQRDAARIAHYAEVIGQHWPP